jgi:hypothetical protein
MSGVPVTAKKKVKYEMAGIGCVVQGFGLVFLIGGFFGGSMGIMLGIFIGLMLLVAGSQLSKKTICSACGNKVPEKTSLMCPTCKATFQK